VSAGAGLTYRALAQEAKPIEAGQAARGALPAARPSPDDLEALWQEVRALRERVKALETEVQALRPRGGRAVGAMGGSRGIGMAGGMRGGPPGAQGSPPPMTHRGSLGPGGLGPMMRGGGGALRGRSAQPGAPAEGAADPLAGAEAAMKRLRQNPNDQEAVAAMQQALRDKIAAREQAHRDKIVKDLVKEVEDALKRFRANPEDKQAAEALEQALERLKQQQWPDGPAASPAPGLLPH
jgi:hypothetical protein